MKIVYVKIKDPVAWERPDAQFYEEDIKHFTCNIMRNAGILIYENEEMLVLGEISIAEDNPKLDDLGLKFPRYRDVMIIAKENILDRQDFELKKEETKT